MKPLAVDSQSLIWFLEGHAKLSPAARAALDDDDARLLLPTICVCEIHATLQKGKYGLDFASVKEAIETSGRIETVPIDYDLAIRSVELQQLDGIHDRLIVATTMRLQREHPDLRLATSDAKILASNLVPTLW